MNTFLLKNAVGNNIRLEPLQAARAAMGSKDQSIQLRGDVIQQRLGGQNGFILWNGVDYTWYAPGITKVAAPRTIHAKVS